MLTRTEQKVLDAIRLGILEHGRSPSYDRIARATGLKSKGRVCVVINGLVRDGVLVRNDHADGRARYRSLTPAPDQNTVSLNLEPNMARHVRALAERHGFTPEAIIIEALRDALGLAPRRAA